MRLTAVVLLGIALLGLPVLAAPIPKEDKKTNAEKLLGKWELVKSGMDDAKDVKFIVEFAKDGVMSLALTPKEGGETTKFKGKYKVNDDKIDYEMEQPGGETKKEILTIKKLTDAELVTVDPDDVKEEFKRVKEKNRGEGR